MKKRLSMERMEQSILVIRGYKVMLDSDLALLYHVPTKRLGEQVRRNIERFPADFMFQLTAEEFEALRSHFATLKPVRGGHRKYLPYVFTEQGVAMLSSVLHSDRAIAVNIEIMRAFVQDTAKTKIFRSLKNKKGSAMIELMVFAPVAALFILLILQFAALFSQQIHSVAVAEAKASHALRGWNEENRAHGFLRPCIEKVKPMTYSSDKEPIQIGAGPWRKILSIAQEVRIVSDPICSVQ